MLKPLQNLSHIYFFYCFREFFEIIRCTGNNPIIIIYVFLISSPSGGPLNISHFDNMYKLETLLALIIRSRIIISYPDKILCRSKYFVKIKIYTFPQ